MDLRAFLDSPTWPLVFKTRAEGPLLRASGQGLPALPAWHQAHLSQVGWVAAEAIWGLLVREFGVREAITHLTRLHLDLPRSLLGIVEKTPHGVWHLTGDPHNRLRTLLLRVGHLQEEGWQRVIRDPSAAPPPSGLIDLIHWSRCTDPDVLALLASERALKQEGLVAKGRYERVIEQKKDWRRFRRSAMEQQFSARWKHPVPLAELFRVADTEDAWLWIHRDGAWDTLQILALAPDRIGTAQEAHAWGAELLRAVRAVRLLPKEVQAYLAEHRMKSLTEVPLWVGYAGAPEVPLVRIVLPKRRANPAVTPAQLLALRDHPRLTVERCGTELILRLSAKVLSDLGFLSLQRQHTGIWRITLATARDGFGPLLYDLALELVNRAGDKGLAPDPRRVTPAAEAVWSTYFHHRPDVQHTLLRDGSHRDRRVLHYYYTKTTGTPFLDALQAGGALTLPQGV
jgi:hypothetical protein